MANVTTTKGRGCFFYGCVTSVVLLVILAGSIYFGVRQALKSFLETFTEASPRALPEAVLTPGQREELDKRLARFRQGLEQPREGAAETLVLSAEEINALIAAHPGMNEWKGRVYVEIPGGEEVVGQVSIPLEKFGPERFKGRFLNGTGRFKVTLEAGELNIELRSAEVKGKPLPEKFLTGFKGSNLAPESLKSPEAAEILSRVEEMEFGEGKVTLRGKASSGPVQ